MANPTLYKKVSNNTLRDRQSHTPEASEITRINTVIDKFFELFKNKHLG